MKKKIRKVQIHVSHKGSQKQFQKREIKLIHLKLSKKKTYSPLIAKIKKKRKKKRKKEEEEAKI